MKAIKKDFAKIPSSLTDETRKKSFEKNREERKYVTGTDYKTNDVFVELKEIYKKKCAFCEDNLLNSPKHIEHYRPKNKDERRTRCDAKTSYYWLAFSWDNLLLACTSCNSSKGSCFDIEGERFEYNNNSLLECQNTINELNKTELPLLINPEQEKQDFFNKNIRFELTGVEIGEIKSENKRLSYTINVCKLNREELVEKRLLIYNDIRNSVKRKKDRFKIHTDNEKYKQDIKDILMDEIERIKCNRSFTAWRKHLIENIKKIEQSC